MPIAKFSKLGRSRIKVTLWTNIIGASSIVSSVSESIDSAHLPFCCVVQVLSRYCHSKQNERPFVQIRFSFLYSVFVSSSDDEVFLFNRIRVIVSDRQQGLDIVSHRVWFCLGPESFDWISFVIDQEFSEIPQNVGRAIVKGNCVLQTGKYGPCIGSIDVALGEENQSFTLPAVRSDKVTNLVSVPGLLFEELIAGEGKYFQSLIPVIIDQVGKLCVIRFGQTSFRGHVDHNQDVTDVLRHVDDRAVEESIGERRELRI